MNEIEKVSENVIEIINSQEIAKFKDDAIGDFMKMVLCGDDSSGISCIKNITEMLIHIPTVLFWRKFQQFLLGTYRDFGEQVKMSSKFCNDNKKYKEFVLQMMETVDKLDDDIKVDYYSRITRSVLLELIDKDLFYKLRQILLNCTVSELKFVDDHKENERFDYNIMIFSLKNYGLVEQITDEKTYYIFTDLAKRLKEHALSGDDSPKHKVAYLELTAPKDMEIASDADVNEALGNIFGK